MANSNGLPNEFQPVEDPAYTEDSVDRSIAANYVERERSGFKDLPGLLSPDAHLEQLERIADMQTVFKIAAKYGGARVQNWIRNYERGGSL